MKSLTLTPGKQFSVMEGSHQLTTLRCDPNEPKPCIHPLVSPSGRVLSGFEPSDHRWHRGLWFSIKFVGEDNFWEEDEVSGKQVILKHPSISCEEDKRFSIGQLIAWRRSTGDDAFRENRKLLIEHSNEAVRIDWTTELTPTEDVHIDRMPFTTFGGYTGLGLRTTRELHQVKFISEKGEHEAVAGDRYPWLACDGLLDGPYNEDKPAAAGVLMLVDSDHPGFPVPFYAKTGGGFTFMNPAFLFHGGMDLKKGEKITFRYRIVTVDGHWRSNLHKEISRFNRGE